jgi:hypothetical protein
MLFATPALTGCDRRVLSEVDEMRIRLRQSVQGRPDQWTAGFRNFLTADAVAASNSIEGFRVSTQDAQDLIAREGVLAPEFSSIEAWLGRPGNTWEYYQELQRRGATYRPDQDVSGWIRFNLTVYHQQAQTVQHRMDQSAAVWESLAAFAGESGLDERMVSALHDVAVAGRVRRARYERAEGLSMQQAQRDLRDLVTAGLLAPVGRTRARCYVEGARFPGSVLEQARTPFSLTSPY